MNSDSPIQTLPGWLLWLTAAVEGAAVMGVEISSARMVEPFYGASIYVWSAVLTTTLIGLMIGYSLGGYLSKKDHPVRVLRWVISALALLLFVMPWLGKGIMNATLGLNLMPGIFISCIVFLMPVLACCAMVTPLLVRLGVRSAEDSGKITGLVYGVSTLGGIVAVFLFGFYLIPTLGLKASLLSMAILVTMVAALHWMGKGK